MKGLTMWVTYRRGLQLGLKHLQIVTSKRITVHAPNGISWTAYEVADDLKAK